MHITTCLQATRPRAKSRQQQRAVRAALAAGHRQLAGDARRPHRRRHLRRNQRTLQKMPHSATSHSSLVSCLCGHHAAETRYASFSHLHFFTCSCLRECRCCVCVLECICNLAYPQGLGHWHRALNRLARAFHHHAANLPRGILLINLKQNTCK